MKPEQRKQRLALTLLFSGVVFSFFVVTMIVVGGVIIYLIQRGILEPVGQGRRGHHLIFRMMIASVMIGSILSAVASRIPLRPVNAIINAMNRLASGDFKTRLSFGKYLSKHPTAKEISRSFNNLAEELERTEILRSDFINNFSHEFKTPIVSIAGFAKLLKHGNLTEDQKAEYIDIIEEESMRLAAMATNVLNLTKVENQTILTGVTEFNMSEQIRNCFLLLENKWTKKNITPELDFGEHTIRANEEMLKQVWINLIDNAIKFGDEGSTVRVTITETEKNIFVSISDTGVEIPMELRERIFQKFYQADESHSGEGNGVGLAVVKEIVRLHNGDVTVSSGNRKTVFTVSLPK
ncbi:MAG TPA: HAMP domain-containing sensor histidine kinase [Clostridiales bacterium]|nr:HAMP domain-containing sensor histidine kinase [Clostridiales bacterium]HPP35135.1 HAMP domain-containing sensor histidine kinase [Clostridiales bacterium]